MALKSFLGLGLASLVASGCASTTTASQGPPAMTPAAGTSAERPAPAHLSTTGEAKGATGATKKANEAVKNALPFADTQDFADAKKGFLGTSAAPSIKNDKGQVVWDFEAFSFLKGEAPPEVNPSLWRIAQLNSLHGLFAVTDNIFQVRGFDLSVTSFIEGKTGVVVVDPLLTKETAAAALALYRTHRGNKPLVAVIYTHSHADHFGGVRGMVDEKDVKAGKVKIVAPDGFMEHAVSENVYAGNAMSRRASYMYGPMLPKGPTGNVDAGLGKTTSSGEVTLIPPTDTVTKTGQKLRLAGLEFEFLMAPGTEAPSEMLFYIAEYKALCAAEDVTHTLHNLYTLRGAQVRDPLVWARYLQQTLSMWGGGAEVLFASHHWPTWGNAAVTKLIKSQRDLYKYIHDQTLHMANQGFTMLEIAEKLELPPALGNVWANRGYYGTVSHDVKAVYQRYLGWFDGNPSHLNTLPPEEAGKKYVEFMGGADAVLQKAKSSIDAGEYRWAAQVLNHVVFADPKNEKARLLLGDTLEQLGYQAESGPWRGFYLTGAMELRKGVRQLPAPDTATPDVVAGMTPEMFLDFLAIRLDAKKAAGKTLAFGLIINDKKKQEFTVVLENSVLNYTVGKPTTKLDGSIALDMPTLAAVGSGKLKLADAVQQKKVTVEGDQKRLEELLGLFSSFEFWFPIVTP
jgi:alkyl sulfatase BDS1-like metallo-beta-lactamase superfamily hydrolase